MYACGLFGANFMDSWEDTDDKSWSSTHPHFTRQFNKERRKLDREKYQQKFESSAVFCKAPHPNTLDTPQGGATNTTTDRSFIAAMEYAAEIGENANAQAKLII